MVVGYFAETKGVVGCEYQTQLVFKVRGPVVVSKLNIASLL